MKRLLLGALFFGAGLSFLPDALAAIGREAAPGMTGRWTGRVEETGGGSWRTDTIYGAVDESIDAVFPDTLPPDSLFADSLSASDGGVGAAGAAVLPDSTAEPEADACPTLADCMAEILQAPFLLTSDVGISVYDLTDDSTLYAYHSDKLYRPASTQKLFTAIAALDRMGTDYAVETLVLGDSVQTDSVWHGNLYLLGRFDSEFNAGDMQHLVQSLADHGIRRIEGKVYADVSMKDSLPYNPGWCWDDGYYDYQPELTPLIYHKGYLTLRLTASSSRRRSAISVNPPTELYTFDNRTGGSGAFRLYRNLTTGSRVIHLRGRVRSRSTQTITIPRPYELFADVFLQELGKAGIVSGGYGGVRRAPLSVDTIGGVRRPVQHILERALKNSDNLSAEAMFFQLGYFHRNEGKPAAEHTPCASDDGAEAVRRFLLDAGLNASDYGISDGCGLSLYNRTSADALVVALRYAAYRRPLFEEIYEALPIAGVDGTLRRRMKGSLAEGNVRAKTGSMSGVSTLAGYCVAPNGHLLAFAILNQNARRSADARALQDRICKLLCRYVPRDGSVE